MVQGRCIGRPEDGTSFERKQRLVARDLEALGPFQSISAINEAIRRPHESRCAPIHAYSGRDGGGARRAQLRDSQVGKASDSHCDLMA